MRTKIIKRWAIFIAVLSLIGGTGFFTQRFQVTRQAKSVEAKADAAVEDGNFAKAETLYREHLVVFPEDVEIKIKYADTLLKADSSPKRQDEALQIYAGILRGHAGRADVRRKQMELKIDKGYLPDAEADLKILLNMDRFNNINMDENKGNGHLMFLFAQCREGAKNDDDAVKDAVKYYRAAIENNAPEQITAYKQLATLLRSQLNQPGDADKAIEAMVRSAPKNYLVYLARGRYRRQFALPESGADFQKALELAEGSPEVYLEMARTAETESGLGAARQILEVGLKRAPSSAALYEALAGLERRTGHIDQAVKTLERGLESSAEKGRLHLNLAELLAGRGETAKLLLQIEELKKIGFSQMPVQFLTAQYYINSSEFREARELLVAIESIAGLPPDFKASVNDMLAQCYGRLGEPDMQQEAYIRALKAKPKDVTAKLGLITRMVSQGELDGAIKEYRTLVKQIPEASLRLAPLLIIRNRQRPAPQRDWTEVKSLIDAAQKSSPSAAEPLILRANLYLAQDKYAEAQDELEKARSRFPGNVAIRCAQADLMGLRKQFSEARTLLDQAQKELGNSVELRLQRAKLAVAKGGPQVVNELNDLSQNLELFSKDQRRTLLNSLAFDFLRLQDLQGASRLWSRLVEQDPNDLDLRLKLLDVAFQTANSNEIEKNIKQIEQLEGSEGFQSRRGRARYLIWQAERAAANEPEEALRLRTKARVLLNELLSRRSDSPVIPMALAQLEQQELRQGSLSDQEIQAKEESIIRFYRRAIELGERSPAIMRETVKLLFKNKRGSEVIDLLHSLPEESQLAGDLERQAVASAVESKDFQSAKEIARKAVAANPADFQERLSLVRILMASDHPSEAETVIREAIDLSKNDPDRWIALVKVLLLNKHLVEAAKAIKDAEASLPKSEAPLTLAQCCELMGKACEKIEDQKQWYALAKGWYEKAQAIHPDDLSIPRRLTNFFLQTKQIAEVEAQLDAILKRGARPQNAETVAWARRTLALTLASDPQRVRDALSILEPAAQAGQGAKALEDPEDLRVLARVLAAQSTIQHRERAIKILDSSVDKNLANAEDRFLLAQLEEINGDWPQALKVYRDLNLRTKNPRDLEALSRHLGYLAQFARSLLRNHKAGDDQDLIETQSVVDELKRFQPDHLSTLILQVGVYQARNQLDKAVDLIQTSAKRSDLAPNAIETLAGLAEKLNRFDIAEPLYRQYAALLKPRDGVIVQALFLARNGHVKEALDLCEPLWANPQNVEVAAQASVEVITSSNDPPDQLQVDRVAGWLERAVKQESASTLLLTALGNCRERQTRYDDAKTLYERVIKQGPRNAVASSKMIANSYNNLAWLLALTGAQGKDALEDIDHAIKLEGPLPDYLDTRGIIYLTLKRTQDAINDLEIAVKADPSPSRLFHLTQAYLQANNRERAKQYWKGAMDKKLDQIRFGPRGLHPLEQLAYQKVRGELGLP
jgi:cellulose synthase operon protein C